MKRGVFTSEFWLTVLTVLSIGLTAVINNGILGTRGGEVAGLCLTIITAVYTLARSMVKSNQTPVVDQVPSVG